ncbi:hypothetical protein KSP39_PZI016493 [Platanthera zijinensis]|uniref:Uncharacterized protein n=1 Tax=Platanthera zijinensis TaxID=2320716 RepID=A0AAP0B7B0_9ASPA
MSFKFTVELDIPNAIFRHGMPTTIVELFDRLSIPEGKAHRLRILMHLLSSEGIFKSHITLSSEEVFEWIKEEISPIGVEDYGKKR